MKEITSIKRTGNSLGVILTRICNALELHEGDLVEIDVRKIKITQIEYDDEEGGIVDLGNEEGTYDLSKIISQSKSNNQTRSYSESGVYDIDKTAKRVKPDYRHIIEGILQKERKTREELLELLLSENNAESAADIEKDMDRALKFMINNGEVFRSPSGYYILT